MRAFQEARTGVRLAARRMAARSLACPSRPPNLWTPRGSLPGSSFGGSNGAGVAPLSTFRRTNHPDARDDIGALEARARAFVADTSRDKNANVIAYLFKLLPMHSALPRAKAVLALVAPHVSSCAGYTSFDIACTLYGLNGFGMDVPGMTIVLSAMPRHIDACRDAFSAQRVSMSLYGLRRCKGELGVAYVCGVLAALAPHILRCRVRFRAQNVSNSLYGLQGYSSEHAEVRSVLSALTPHIEQCEEHLNAQEVGNSLYGLQGCSSEHAEVRAVLRALAPQIERCKELDALGVTNSLYGLQGCSSEHPEVRAVLSALVPHIARCKETLSAHHVGHSLVGLRGCSSEHPEVRAVLSALAPHIARCKVTLSALNIGDSLLGLQGCSSEHPEVRAVLSALTPHVERCQHLLRAQTVGNSLYGLQGCSSQHPEVRAVLGALALQIVRCETLNAVAVGNALYGLQGCSSEHAETIMAALTPRLHRLLDQLKNPDGLSALSAGDLLPVTHGCAAFLRPKRMLSSSRMPLDLLESLYRTCARELESRPVKSLQIGESEASFRARAIALFSSVPLSVSVRPDACYLHGFEADIVLVVHPPSGTTLAPVTVNVEVDGRMHRDGKSRLFCAVRDAHLRSRGVAVLRWDLLARSGESERAFETWLGRKINVLRFRSLSLVPPPAPVA